MVAGYVDYELQPNEVQFQQALSRWAGDIRSLRGILQETVREEILPAYERRFDEQGPGWQPLSPDYARQRQAQYGSSSPILDRRRGAIGLKYRATQTLSFWSFTDREAYVDMDKMKGSDVGYGFHHVSGGPVMPQRTWISMSEGEITSARDRVGDWLADVADKNLRWIF